jgi:peptidoglycan/LPS O-acetylase OafA/YrhL
MSITATNQDKRVIFFPNLDGLRFFSFFAVFILHAFSATNKVLIDDGTYKFVRKYFIEGGHLGVNFFFVLSGFLITYLLINETEVAGKINIKNFYIRRVLRIWPLYFFNVFFGFVLFPVLKKFLGEVPQETADPFYFFTFLANFNNINNGIPDSSILAVLWSVSIEEQFYIFWPLLLAFIHPKHYIKLNIGIIIISFLFQVYNRKNGLVVGLHSISCFTELATGALVASLAIHSKKFMQYIINLPKVAVVILYAIALVLYIFKAEVFTEQVVFMEHLVFSIVFGLIIAEQCFSNNSFYKMKNLKTISSLGKYTYGLYCLHMIAILIIEKLFSKAGIAQSNITLGFIQLPLALVLSVIIAYISFRFFESPFLKLKNKFSVIVKE